MSSLRPSRWRAALVLAALVLAAADGRYRLSLDSTDPAGQLRGSVSQAALDASGLAPERYTEGRRGRETRAVNFQHEAGLITYSGPCCSTLCCPAHTTA